MKNPHPKTFGGERGIVTQCASCGTVYESAGSMSVCPNCSRMT